MTQPDGQLHVVFFNVGQGDATFIQTPSGRQILVDGGLYPSILNDQLGRQMPFWDKEIDMLVATHADADHVSGLVGVFDRYRVNQLITNGEGFGESPIYDEVLAAAQAQATEIRPVQAGEVIEFGDGVRLEVVHPGPVLVADNRNENSVSMRLVYGDFTFFVHRGCRAGGGSGDAGGGTAVSRPRLQSRASRLQLVQRYAHAASGAAANCHRVGGGGQPLWPPGPGDAGAGNDRWRNGPCAPMNWAPSA
jgi:hypothetical protein